MAFCCFYPLYIIKVYDNLFHAGMVLFCQNSGTKVVDLANKKYICVRNP